MGRFWASIINLGVVSKVDESSLIGEGAEPKKRQYSTFNILSTITNYQSA